MKRVIFAVTGTIAGLIALLSFKTHPAVSTAGGLPSAALPSTATTVPGTSTTPAAGSSAAPAGSSPAPARSSAAQSSPAATTADYTGQAIETRYGTVQVKVSVRSRQITDVSFVQLTSYDGRSQEINSQAGPILLQQTLSAQSAQIDGVSGATYTSQGYEQSLQSALDQAGI